MKINKLSKTGFMCCNCNNIHESNSIYCARCGIHLVDTEIVEIIDWDKELIILEPPTKSRIVPIYKVGQDCLLTTDKEVNEETIKKGSIVTIEEIELTDSKFAELDEIYLVDYCDMTFWVYQNELESTSINNREHEHMEFESMNRKPQE